MTTVSVRMSQALRFALNRFTWQVVFVEDVTRLSCKEKTAAMRLPNLGFQQEKVQTRALN